MMIQQQFSLLIILVVVVLIVASDDEPSVYWKCVKVQDSKPLTTSSSVVWMKENCTNIENADPLLVVNSITIDLTANDIRITPAVSAFESEPLLPLDQLALSNSKQKLIAGINGGYFWRLDITPVWFDDVCRTKVRKEAEHPASRVEPNFGIHDGTVKISGLTVGSNCDCSGYSRPAVITTMGSNSDWEISVMQRGEQPANNVFSALGAGPNLVSFNSTTKTSFIDIPADDDNINIHEHAANTAVGLIFDEDGKAIKMIMVTTDGTDECGPSDQSCGINAPNLASLLLNHFNTQEAMSMDQGGSTTMYIENEGIVSCSGSPCSHSGRNLPNGLFVELL